MKISVIGVGYLGAVHAASMAELGHDVIGLDIDAPRVQRLTAGEAPFHEPGFAALLRRGLDSGRLRFTTDHDELADADAHFLGLGTPQRADGFGADLSALHAAVDALATVLSRRGGTPTIVVGKSTVPAGTARDLAVRLEQVPGVRLLWNPEFLREGYAVRDTLSPDRLVYGVRHPESSGADGQAGDGQRAGAEGDASGSSELEVGMLDAIYAPLLEAGVTRLVMGFEAAELVKVSANAFLATKISFINAIAELCEATGADVTDVAGALGMDDRIGGKFLRAGVGFGGGCLPKDIRALIAGAEDLGLGQSVGFLREVDAINQRRRVRVVEMAREMLGPLRGRRITVLGAAFKPDSDDVRDSPALEIASRLMAAGAQVTVTDPEALENARHHVEGLVTVADTAEALRGAELVMLLTEWRRYRDLHPAEAAALVAAPRIIDGRTVLDPRAWREAGWDLRALGRPGDPAASPVAPVRLLAGT
ncbi:UDP-glucose dehydrogenase family protein [Brachybacterium sacelli]|uniref:UDP-glucose 6-dehydrogenase n=1 Tax=Brachybacterium sacelli TaxID=173364 RepID=A0ABS4WXU3_9MICO|nr:UDP-glucose/GDP-mannose dehydrogenase family protein [Brachybacterium sacelli]MBP2381022.1 UDPglucose 6-dehydrogenase [Brachybacterium sacelli]